MKDGEKIIIPKPFGGRNKDNDPGGCYTGTPSGPDIDLTPEQDADDL